MNMRLLLSFSLILLSYPAAADHDQHWSYEGNEGPEHWGELSKEFETCKSGKNQSPINLPRPSASTQKSNLTLVSEPIAEYKIENNGHTLQATPLTNNVKIRLNQTLFQLKQFHFHVPSEYTFKGKHFPIEGHFVHQSEKGELAVISLMFKEGKSNPALTPLLTQILKPRESTQQSVNLKALYPKSTEHFRLNGSLTTPPCSEGVNWIIFETPVSASKEQIETMKRIIGHTNNRPLQPINSRIIIEEK
ncbi:MAG: carbonic anhydrase family protein [Neisseria sp.]|uniref:carbonic anhydrase n=1 Tax=Neisseria sp. TaxID=192066 RepID=UPI0026DCBF0C|nr:carbonic anhydrase family protein [Neisseria sp.]MDO4640638.1 carbonic anhydrase family protein [Neisseria sp.]